MSSPIAFEIRFRVVRLEARWSVRRRSTSGSVATACRSIGAPALLRWWSARSRAHRERNWSLECQECFYIRRGLLHIYRCRKPTKAFLYNSIIGHFNMDWHGSIISNPNYALGQRDMVSYANPCVKCLFE